MDKKKPRKTPRVPEIADCPPSVRPAVVSPAEMDDSLPNINHDQTDVPNDTEVSPDGFGLPSMPADEPALKQLFDEFYLSFLAVNELKEKILNKIDTQIKDFSRTVKLIHNKENDPYVGQHFKKLEEIKSIVNELYRIYNIFIHVQALRRAKTQAAPELIAFLFGFFIEEKNNHAIDFTTAQRTSNNKSALNTALKKLKTRTYTHAFTEQQARSWIANIKSAFELNGELLEDSINLDKTDIFPRSLEILNPNFLPTPIEIKDFSAELQPLISKTEEPENASTAVKTTDFLNPLDQYSNESNDISINIATTEQPNILTLKAFALALKSNRGFTTLTQHSALLTTNIEHSKQLFVFFTVIYDQIILSLLNDIKIRAFEKRNPDQLTEIKTEYETAKKNVEAQIKELKRLAENKIFSGNDFNTWKTDVSRFENTYKQAINKEKSKYTCEQQEIRDKSEQLKRFLESDIEILRTGYNSFFTGQCLDPVKREIDQRIEASPLYKDFFSVLNSPFYEEKLEFFRPIIDGFEHTKRRLFEKNFAHPFENTNVAERPLFIEKFNQNKQSKINDTSNTLIQNLNTLKQPFDSALRLANQDFMNEVREQMDRCESAIIMSPRYLIDANVQNNKAVLTAFLSIRIINSHDINALKSQTNIIGQKLQNLDQNLKSVHVVNTFISKLTGATENKTKTQAQQQVINQLITTIGGLQTKFKTIKNPSIQTEIIYINEVLKHLETQTAHPDFHLLSSPLRNFIRHTIERLQAVFSCLCTCKTKTKPQLYKPSFFSSKLERSVIQKINPCYQELTAIKTDLEKISTPGR